MLLRCRSLMICENLIRQYIKQDMQADTLADWRSMLSSFLDRLFLNQYPPTSSQLLHLPYLPFLGVFLDYLEKYLEEEQKQCHVTTQTLQPEDSGLFIQSYEVAYSSTGPNPTPNRPVWSTSQSSMRPTPTNEQICKLYSKWQQLKKTVQYIQEQEKQTAQMMHKKAREFITARMRRGN